MLPYTFPYNHTGYAQVLEQWSPSGSNPDVTYTIGDDVVTQYDPTNGARHLLYDGHGSTRQLVDNNEDVTDAFSYDGYGVMLGANPANAATSLLYTGEMYDSSASMYYLRARWYDQQTGRFNRMDPFAGNTQDPQSLHKYLYAHCNPITNIDPSGQLTTLQSVGLAIAIAAVVINICLTVYSGLRHKLSAKMIALNVLHNLLIFAVIFGAVMLTGPVAIAAGVTLWIAAGWGLYNLIENWHNMDGVDKLIAFGQIATYMMFAGGLAAFRAGAPPQVSEPEPLNWTKVVKQRGPRAGETRVQHVRSHEVNNPVKEYHGVFNGESVATTNTVWNNKGSTPPVQTTQGTDIYVLPKESVGWSGGKLGSGQTLHHVTIITEAGTPNLITAFPSPPPPASPGPPATP